MHKQRTPVKAVAEIVIKVNNIGQVQDYYEEDPEVFRHEGSLEPAG